MGHARRVELFLALLASVVVTASVAPLPAAARDKAPSAHRVFLERTLPAANALAAAADQVDEYRFYFVQQITTWTVTASAT